MTALYLYQPGNAHLAVGPAGGILTADAPTALRLWPLISRGAPIAALLEEALSDGLAQLPDLVLFEVDSELLRVVVRGKIGIQVSTAAGDSVQTDGQAVRSWTEQVFAAPQVFVAGEDSPGGLPLTCGIVLATGLRWSAATAPEERASPAPRAAALPVPAAKAPPLPAPPVPATSLPVALVPPAPAETSESARSDSHPAQLRDTRVEPIDDSFEHLFESTIMRSVEDAAVRVVADDESFISAVPTPTEVRAPDEARQFDEPTAVRPGDHDGSTIMAGQLASVLASTGDPQAQPGSAPAAPLSLLLSTGQTISLDRGVVIGRRPQVDRVSGSQLPHLVTVPSPQQDISRSHVAIRPTAGGCVAVDLGSTNGSVIRRATGEAVDLRNSAAIDVQPGDVIDLGDGVTAELRGPA